MESTDQHLMFNYNIIFIDRFLFYLFSVFAVTEEIRTVKGFKTDRQKNTRLA